MPRTCTICAHPKREEIDHALLSGKTYREITGNFPVSKSSLERHRNHITASLLKSREAEEIARGDDLVEDLRALAVEANRLKAEAEKSGNVRAAIAALREITRLIELRAKIAGKLKEGQVNVINVHLDDATATRMAEIYLSRRRGQEGGEVVNQ
jgi:hypothetical protein